MSTGRLVTEPSARKSRAILVHQALYTSKPTYTDNGKQRVRNWGDGKPDHRDRKTIRVDGNPFLALGLCKSQGQNKIITLELTRKQDFHGEDG